MEKENYIVYKFYDKNEILLYVGITNNIKIRLKQHKKDKEWFCEVKNIYISNFLTRNEAHIYEIYSIANLNPKYNIDFSEGGIVSFKLEELKFKEYISYKRNKNKSIPIIKELFEKGYSVKYISEKIQLTEQTVRIRLRELGLKEKEIHNCYTIDEKIQMLHDVSDILYKKIQRNESLYFMDKDILIEYDKLSNCGIRGSEKIIFENKQVKKSINEILLGYDLKRIRCNKKIKEFYQVDGEGYPFIIVKNN